MCLVCFVFPVLSCPFTYVPLFHIADAASRIADVGTTVLLRASLVPCPLLLSSFVASLIPVPVWRASISSRFTHNKWIQKGHASSPYECRPRSRSTSVSTHIVHETKRSNKTKLGEHEISELPWP
jgi:hypothetical protein